MMIKCTAVPEGGVLHHVGCVYEMTLDEDYDAWVTNDFDGDLILLANLAQAGYMFEDSTNS